MISGGKKKYKRKGSECMSRTNAENKARKGLYSLRARLVIRFGKKGARRIWRAVYIASAVFVLMLLAFIFVRISEIEVTGDVTMFNESEVIRAAEIDIGDGLFWKPSWAIKRNIRKNMPIAQNIKVTKTPFGKVTINIELLSVDYYTEVGDMYYALDSELTVLDANVSGSKYSAYGAVLVKLPEVREPRIGERLVFYDTVEETDTEKETLYPVREESFYAYTSRFLKALKESGFHPESNGVILTEKFDVTLIYAEKFSICFGNSNELEVKFRVLYEILAEGSTQYSDRVSIDLSDPSRATARTDLTLDFSEFID